MSIQRVERCSEILYKGAEQILSAIILMPTLPLAVVTAARSHIPETLWHNPTVPVSGVYAECIIPTSFHNRHLPVLRVGPMNNEARDEQANLQ